MAKSPSRNDERDSTVGANLGLRAAAATPARTATASGGKAGVPSTKPSENLPSRNILPETQREVTGATEEDLHFQLLCQAAGALASPKGDRENDIRDKLLVATAALKGIAPRDELEGMLAVQMIATHDAAMQCLVRAALPNQMLEARDHHLKHATKLMAVYERQLAALDKHRGKGQQKITVEHVTVQAGGQAIVGSVETGRSNAFGPTHASSEPAPAASGNPSRTKLAGDLSADDMPEHEVLAPENAPNKVSTRKSEAG